MVTSVPSDYCVTIQGLSTDKKPICKVLNGSQYLEMDTSTLYLFDQAAKQWLKFSGGNIDMQTALNEHTYQFMGLSSDTKPIDCQIGNGSKFIEMDTSDIYMYDRKNRKWLKQKPQGGQPCPCVEYTAGDHIEISEDHVISAKIDLEKEIIATLTVGGISEGETFPAGTPIEEIITKLLSKQPVDYGTIYFGVVDSTPDEITADAEAEKIPDDFRKTGITHYYTTRGDQFEWVAYPANLGQLKTIYENDLPFNLLENYTSKTITAGGVDYLLYWYVDPVRADNDKFVFYWKNDCCLDCKSC